MSCPEGQMTDNQNAEAGAPRAEAGRGELSYGTGLQDADLLPIADTAALTSS